MGCGDPCIDSGECGGDCPECLILDVVGIVSFNFCKSTGITNMLISINCSASSD